MTWNSNYLILQRITDALRSKDSQALKTMLSSIPRNQDRDEVSPDITRLMKKIDLYIRDEIQQSLAENNYERFIKATALYRTPLMLSDNNARNNYRETIKEFNPAFEKIFTPAEQIKALEQSEKPISKMNFEAFVEQQRAQEILPKPAAS